MDEAVRKAGVKTLVGYVLHYNPLFVTAKKIQKDFIGELKYAETDYFHRVMGDIPCYQWTCKKSVGGQLPAGRRLPRRGCHAVVYAGRGGVRLRPVQQNAHGSRV